MIQKFIIFSFLFSLSATSAFAVNDYLRAYVILSLALITLCLQKILFSGRIPKIKFEPHLFSALIFIAYLWIISIFINNEKTLIYLGVYSFFYILLLFSVDYLLNKYGYKLVLSLNSTSIIIISLLVIIEFILFHTFNFDIHDYIPRIGPTPDATVLVLIRRAYGLSNEPTNLSAYLVAFGGLAIYFWYKTKSSYINFRVLIVIVALLFTFSGSALGGFIIATLLCFPIFIAHAIIYRSKKSIILISTILALGLVLVTFDATLAVTDKFKLDGNFGSGRGESWISFFELIVKNDFAPHGLGSASLLGFFPINSYLLVLYEGGLAGLIFYAIFHLIPIFSILISRLDYFDKMFLSFVLIISVSQLAAFDTFYYPYTIIYIAIVSYISKKNLFAP